MITYHSHPQVPLNPINPLPKLLFSLSRDSQQAIHHLIMQWTRFKTLLMLGFIVAISLSVISHAEETTEEVTTHEPESTKAPEDDEHHDGTISRVKRQFGCPSGCYSACTTNYQCRRYSARSVCVQGCCCGSSTNISTACDGDAAVAACLNGLCGQG